MKVSKGRFAKSMVCIPRLYLRDLREDARSLGLPLGMYLGNVPRPSLIGSLFFEILFLDLRLKFRVESVR